MKAMAIKVLIVDDSGFFRRRLKEMIESNPQFTVVGTAQNGREAVDMTRQLRPDVITMDYEMPVMDGISAVRTIMAECPVPILMFSSMTYEGAKITLESLEAGAVDYLPKNFAEISNNSAALKKKLFDTLATIAKANTVAAPSPSPSASPAPTAAPSPAAPAPRSSAAPAAPARGGSRIQHSVRDQAAIPRRAAAAEAVPDKPAPRRSSLRGKSISLIAIGTSTGGPVALQKLLAELPKSFRLPIVLIQHMPGSFTQAFAERLNSCCQIDVKQAQDGDRLKPGQALLAPGGSQMMITGDGTIRILKGDARMHYKPSVDVTFGSAANVYRDKVLGIILTGMGADGCDGARLLKQKGSTVWAQDRETSTIYGMPMAVAKAGLADEILALPEFGKRLLEIE